MLPMYLRPLSTIEVIGATEAIWLQFIGRTMTVSLTNG